MDAGVYQIVTDSVSTVLRTTTTITSGTVTTGSNVNIQSTVDNTDPAWPAIDILLSGGIESHTDGATVDIYIRYLDVFGAGSSEPVPVSGQELGLIKTFGVASARDFLGVACGIPITEGKFELYFVPRGVTFKAASKIKIRRSSGAPKNA